VVLLIVAWIGYTMATTPPPTPLEPEPTSSVSEAAGTTGRTEAK